MGVCRCTRAAPWTPTIWCSRRRIRRSSAFICSSRVTWYSLQAYLREAVVNRIRDAVRRQVRRGLADNVPDPLTSLEERSDEHSPSPLEELLKQETVERYRRGLKMLKPEEQRAVVLRLELELDYEEVAEQLGKPSGAAARMAAKRALEKLAQVLKENP